jgi:hypothetical protein
MYCKLIVFFMSYDVKLYRCESDTDEQMVEAQIVDDTNPKKAKGKAAAVKSTNPKKAKGKDTAVESTNPKKTKVEATAVDVDGYVSTYCGYCVVPCAKHCLAQFNGVE